MSFHKVLCPIDFSPGSTQAMRTAIRLANEGDGELVLAHAWFMPSTAFAGEMLYPPDILDAISADAEQSLLEGEREAKKLGAKRISRRLLVGMPAQAIVGALEEDVGFDLVVLGTHGRTGVARVLLGSVAEKVVRHAPCSVLVARPDTEPRAFGNVLVPTDFSDASGHAAELAASLVRSGGTITLFHVVEAPVAFSGEPMIPDMYRSLEKRTAVALDQAATALRGKANVTVATTTRNGRAGGETLAEVERGSYDLVVMGSHGRHGIARVLLGSVAEKVVRHAHCPVLVARRR